MRILQIAPQVPYPLLDGGKIGIFQLTKHLSLRGHEVTLACFQRDPLHDVKELTKYCTLHPVIHSTRNSLFKGALNLLSDIPYNISKYQSDAMRRTLSKLLAGKAYDVVHVDHLHMAEYGIFCRDLAGVPAVLREHNVESTIMERAMAESGNPLVKAYLSLHLRRIQAYEKTWAGKYDVCCVITENDRERLSALGASVRTHVVPGGVDEAMFDELEGMQRIEKSICFFGGMDWLPNQDGVRWFIREIMPHVREQQPAATFHVIGKKTPSEIRQLESDSVHMVGFVDDLKREIGKYDVMVVPLRIGGGMRLKILESFAMRIPVVSTSIGCEGIAAHPEEHLLVADEPREFAHQILRILEDRSLKAGLVRAAYRLADVQYRWSSAAAKLEAAYEEAIEMSRDRSAART